VEVIVAASTWHPILVDVEEVTLADDEMEGL